MTFDMDQYTVHDFAAEVEKDLRFELQLAIRCVISVLAVVILVLARQSWFV